MKKIILFSLIVLIGFFLKFDLKAACPSGYGYTQTTRLVTVGGCDFNVEICYKCMGIQPGEIRVWGFTKIDPNCDPGLDENQIAAAIYGTVYSPIYLNTLCGLPGPCESGNELWYTEIYEICWWKTYLNGNIWYFPCNLENCYCWILKKLCWDGFRYVSLTVQGPAWSCSGYNDDPLEKCPLEPEQVGVPTEQNPHTDCFHLWTPCNLP